MFLSVSIPVYNAEKYIEKCVESIIKQTYKDFEIILVNDGSKDKSLEKCYELEKKYPNFIKVIDKKNTGSLFTRRECIKSSSGDYLYIMDADDYLVDENAFKDIKDTIEAYECDMVIFNATSDDLNEYYKYSFSDRQIFEKDDLEKIYKYLIEGDELNPLWNKVFSRKLIDWEYDYSKFDYVQNGTDMFQTIPIILNAKKIVYRKKIFYHYRINDNENSIVHKFNPNIYISLRANFLRLYEELDKKKVLTVEMKKLLNLRYMKIASTAAFKVRLIGKKEYDIYEYLKNIGEDPIFRNCYSHCNIDFLPKGRKIIVKALFKQKYKCLIWILQIYKMFIKK